ncbi:hypothetical protein [Ruminococcus flavefaciens]|uniref:Uncharacterized protein n=1 Tax=Ruminococcus flavefaciens TaxID=1265 RepID=A0A315XUC6_RUMFL|nr:hypothetical protein [Ruminococcus flavefaciens]PWJ10259.1 hypothetical protein IE37_03149 [Ruminococcus flavefaciens]SSA51999.1 hypothetical protein SAMN02910325_03149 [Ruminococcus flavefaciens]
MNNNPFAVVTPEEMTAEQADRLFVEMYSDFPQIRRPGNSIISGARGCGKSMFIRCSLPDVLMQKENKSDGKKIKFSDLDYLAFSVSCEKTYPNIKEFEGLDDKHTPYLINEHFLALHVLMSALFQLSKIQIENFDKKKYQNFFEDVYKRYMRLSRCLDDINPDYTSSNSFFLSLYRHTEKMQSDLIIYPSQFALNIEGEDYTYNMPLLSFLRFIVPVFKEMTNLPGFPKNKNIIIFVDDADNLSKIQTEIINTWIAYRTQPSISLKISTQLGLYKTHLTTAGVLIESPHDYKEINISNRYTTNAEDKYFDKASEILEKRLKLSGIDIKPEEFFPNYDKQVEGIQKEIELIKKEYPIKGRGNRLDDDVRRYAVPNYISKLGGRRKSRSTYRYAGLENIVHLSSGIIRYLLDAVSDMYETAIVKNKDDNITEISSDIQDRVLRNQADTFLYSELLKLNNNYQLTPINSPANDVEKLQNLICSMGKTFHDILISDRSERKVFSIALSNVPDQELSEIFKLGVRLGFFHETRIGNKEGNGRTLLYIMNRCLAPLFTLDPTGFQGYLFVTNKALHEAIKTAKPLRTLSECDDDMRQLTFDDILEE